MADIIQVGNISVCRKPRILFNDGEHFPIEISFNREITDVDRVDLFGADGLDRPGERLALNDFPQRIPGLFRHLLGVVQERMVEIGR